MSKVSNLYDIAPDLQSAFDRSCILPPASGGIEQTENLLLIRMGGDRYAVRVREIDGLAGNRAIVPLPGAAPEMLGIAGVSSGLVSVYSLAALLGYPPEPGEDRWLALCGKENRIGLAFSALEGYRRIPAANVYAAGQENAMRGHVREIARTADMVRAIVNIPLIMEIIGSRCGGNGRFSVHC